MLPWQTTQSIRYIVYTTHNLLADFQFFCHKYFSLCFFYIVYVIVKTDPTATEHAEEVNSRVRCGDWEDSTDAGASFNQLLQTPSDLRYCYCQGSHWLHAVMTHGSQLPQTTNHKILGSDSCWLVHKKLFLLVSCFYDWLVRYYVVVELDIVLREAPLRKLQPPNGHCPNSDRTPPPPFTRTGTLGHFISGPTWANAIWTSIFTA